MSVLEVRDLSIRFGGLQALQDVNITVNEFEIVGLIGPNGAGKTTAFNCITGFYRPTAGTVTYKGRDVTRVPPHRKCAMGFGRTFQNVGMVKSATALENLKTAQHAAVGYGALAGIVGSGVSLAEERRLAVKADQILELLGLTAVRDTRIGSLSYGTLKLLELGCALATDPEILLLDEPSSGMGPEEAHALGDRLRDLRRELGLTMLLIEHHVPLVLALCDHVYVLNFGRLLASREPSLIQTHPEVVAAYMGGEAPEALAATVETAADAALEWVTPHDADVLAHAHHVVGVGLHGADDYDDEDEDHEVDGVPGVAAAVVGADNLAADDCDDDAAVVDEAAKVEEPFEVVPAARRPAPRGAASPSPALQGRVVALDETDAIPLVRIPSPGPRPGPKPAPPGPASEVGVGPAANMGAGLEVAARPNLGASLEVAARPNAGVGPKVAARPTVTPCPKPAGRVPLATGSQSDLGGEQHGAVALRTRPLAPATARKPAPATLAPATPAPATPTPIALPRPVKARPPQTPAASVPSPKRPTR